MWIATVEVADRPRLIDVVPVQGLAGSGGPFDRLVTLLRSGDHVAAGIDAPFCLPARHLPPGRHHGLLSMVATLPDAPDRPFPSGASLVALAAAVAPIETAKPLRTTEKHWSSRGVNTRSTLWNGPRGGAPFTAACLTLLARVGRPCWPWAIGPGMLIESFPAAQLRAWDLPHTGYAGRDQRTARRIILDELSQRIGICPAQMGLMLDHPDALDAVLAAFGAIAASTDGPPAVVPPDGLISVMDDLVAV
ncbi:hypothetical protein GCM10022268_23400 [Sphingomonas cynarae]|uniref:DUF429 domain-containing protein n=1 Tax=Sphingomonas cynarae TaxID=930197 RepID=A0ABP7E928_9SPHN